MSSNNSSSVLTLFSQFDAQCQAAAALFEDSAFSTVRNVEIAMALPLAALAAYLVRIYRAHKVQLHGNLAMMLAHLLFYYCVHFCDIFAINLRYLIIQLFLTQQPCAWMTPVWLVVLFRTPLYSYFFAAPLIHFAIMLERLRATRSPGNYEHEGTKFGVWLIVILWTTTVVYILAVVALALADQQQFGKPLVVITLSSSYNNAIILSSYYLGLALIFVTILGDYLITRMNKKLRSKNFVPEREYSLSRNYQVRENVVTMRLILPMDILYGTVYSIYMLGASILRANAGKLSLLDYDYYYECLSTLLMLYVMVSLLIYIYFIKFVAKNRHSGVKINPKMEHATIYFQNLQNQWQ